MKSVAVISIVGSNDDVMEEVRWRLLRRHLVAGIRYNECDTAYWQGGQIVQRQAKLIHGITFFEKIPDIEGVLPEGVQIVSACLSTYVNPKTERWLNASVS